MRQARRSNRRNFSNQRVIKHSLREILLFVFFFMGIYLFVSLLTYSAADINLYESKGIKVTNTGGIAGALFADIFVYMFGYFAYLFPIMVSYLGWLIYRGKHRDILAEPRSLIVPGTGFILTLSAGCGLMMVHFAADSSVLLTTHAGGLLGTAVGKSLKDVFSQLGATLLLIALFFTGVTLLTGLSWLKLMDILGFYTLQWSPVVQKHIATQWLPIVLRYGGWALVLLRKLFGNLLERLQGKAKATYLSWQERRAEWREQQDYFDEEGDDYLDEDDPLVAEEKSPPLKTKSGYEGVAEATVNHQENQIDFTPTLPSLHLLEPAPENVATLDTAILQQSVSDAFNTSQIEVVIHAIHPGPVLTGFEVELVSPVRINNLDELGETLAQYLKVPRVRVVETLPRTLGIEIPNFQRQPIYLSELLGSLDYQDSFSPLTVALGKDVNGQVVIIDLTRVPHILMAGIDPNEKIVAINTLILSLIYKSLPSTVRLLLIDSTTCDLAIYSQLPHLLAPIISEPEHVLAALTWCDQEMERRYRLMAGHGMRNIENYNQALLAPEGQDFSDGLASRTDALPYIVVIIHEIAEIVKTVAGPQTEEIITQLAQRARAAGIHLVLATQYPSVNVITGLLKTNLPTRIAFRVTTKSESRTILGQMGAETLLGEGDMLYMTAGTGTPARVHGSFVSVPEVARVVAALKTQAVPVYVNLMADNNPSF